MKKKVLLRITLLPLSWAILNGCSMKEQAQPTLLFNLVYSDMLTIKECIKDKCDMSICNAYDVILYCADSILLLEPHKVIDGDIPPTGDPHDFFSIGKYAFPNPSTVDGLPYVREDGKINPEVWGSNYDLTRYEETIERVNVLALAWFYSGNEKYAAKAAEFLKVWFILPETKMNPNFECAAALPGVYDGMAIGIIFGARFVDFLDHVQLLTLSESWTEADNEKLKGWFFEYTKWLLTSPLGLEESKAGNNHGSWYAAQVAASAIYSGDVELARSMIDKGKKQLEEQIALHLSDYPDGSLPRELIRNQSFLYSLFGLEGFCALAGCGNVIGEDLWHFETEEGRSMKLAFSFLLPYLLEKEPWPYPSIKSPQSLFPKALSMVRLAAKEFQTDELLAAQEHILKYAKGDPCKYLESRNFSK